MWNACYVRCFFSQQQTQCSTSYNEQFTVSPAPAPVNRYILWRSNEKPTENRIGLPWSKYLWERKKHTYIEAGVGKRYTHYAGPKNGKYEHWPLKRINITKRNKGKQISSRHGHGHEHGTGNRWLWGKNDYQICFYYERRLPETKTFNEWNQNENALEKPAIYELWRTGVGVSFSVYSCIRRKSCFLFSVVLGVCAFQVRFGMNLLGEMCRAGYTWANPYTNINILKFVTL